jgi:hypothetical protein
MRSLGVAFAFFLVVGSAWGQVERRFTLPEPVIEMGSRTTRIPFDPRGGRPTVEARLNGQGPYRFYFDTGASGPVMSQRFATELKLNSIGEVQVKSGGDAPDKKPLPGRLVLVDRLELGSAKLSAVIIAAMDRSTLEKDGAPVGVLSPAMFSGYLVTMDFPKKEIRIRPGDLAAPDNKTIFAYLPGRPIPSVMATIVDQTLEVHLDSGSGAGLSLPTKVASKLKLDGRPIDTGKRARSISGEFPVMEGKLKGKFSFGQFSFNDPKIDFSDIVRHGNLGTAILGRFAVTLDVKNRRFRIAEAE